MLCSYLFCLASYLNSKYKCTTQANQNPSQQLQYLSQQTDKTSEPGSLWVNGENKQPGDMRERTEDTKDEVSNTIFHEGIGFVVVEAAGI